MEIIPILIVFLVIGSVVFSNAKKIKNSGSNNASQNRPPKDGTSVFAEDEEVPTPPPFQRTNVAPNQRPGTPQGQRINNTPPASRNNLNPNAPQRATGQTPQKPAGYTPAQAQPKPPQRYNAATSSSQVKPSAPAPVKRNPAQQSGSASSVLTSNINEERKQRTEQLRKEREHQLTGKDHAHGQQQGKRAERAYVESTSEGIYASQGCEEHYFTRYVTETATQADETGLTPLQRMIVFGEIINNPKYKD